LPASRDFFLASEGIPEQPQQARRVYEEPGACVHAVYSVHGQADKALKDMPLIPFESEHNERVRIASDQEYRTILKGVPSEVRPVDRDTLGERLSLGGGLENNSSGPGLLNRALEVKRIREKGGLKRGIAMNPRSWQILTSAAEGKGETRAAIPDHALCCALALPQCLRESRYCGPLGSRPASDLLHAQGTRGEASETIRELQWSPNRVRLDRYSRPRSMTSKTSLVPTQLQQDQTPV